MRKIEISDIIIWISLLVLITYVLAKLVGLINTPEWINLIPIITLIFFAGAFYQKVLGFIGVMHHISSVLNIRKFLHLIYSRELKAIHGNLILSL